MSFVRRGRRPVACDRQITRRGPAGKVLWRLLVIISVGVVLGALYLLRAPILRGVGGLLVVDDELQPADAILVLGDDTYLAERAVHGAQLYRDRWAPRVVASGRYLRPYASIADLMRRDLLDRGVPQSAVLHFAHRAGNTREEAIALADLIWRQRWRRVIVVTSSYHTRRTRYLFRGILEPRVNVRVSAAQDASFDPNAWWQSRIGLKTFARETAAAVVAVWETWTSEKPEPPPPAAPQPAPS
jgi:uncharacterized SAM-binding protein YcdF (DUF218 family)